MRRNLYLFLIAILFSCSTDIQFDKNKWNEKDVDNFFFIYRKQMISDLVKNYLNSDMDRKAIINLLGEPTSKDSEIIAHGEFGYEIYEDYGWDIDPVEIQYLTITFDKDSTLDNVLTPQITGHNLKNKLGLIKFGNHDKRTTKIYT